jgi:hypothetical protein
MPPVMVFAFYPGHENSLAFVRREGDNINVGLKLQDGFAVTIIII